MSDAITLNSRLNVSNDAGAVVGYLLSEEQLRGLEAEAERLRQQVASQTRQIEQLEQENKRLVAQREACWKLCSEIFKDDLDRNEEWWEARIREGMKDALDFGAFVQQLEAELTGGSMEKGNVE
jgi:TolA-binding protein